MGAKIFTQNLMKRLLLDTNVLVRFILGEPEKQAAAVAKLFRQCDEGSVELVLLPMVAAETVFVLSSFYEQERTDIVKVLTHILRCPGIVCDQRDILLRTLRHYAESKAHFVDCYLVANSELTRQSMVSFDRELDKFSAATRLDPVSR